ncbi:hypothetical protein P0F65_12150 [Sphingomonas sp. I4]
MTLHRLIATERRREGRRLRQAAVCAALVAIASILLLALSGWFLSAAALAGGAGIVAAQAFNYMLPSAAIRLLAIVRTGARYGERLASHGAAFGALARLRPALYRAITAAPPSVALALGRGEATARLIGDVDAVEWRFVRLSGPWGVIGAVMSGAGLTLLGDGWRWWRRWPVPQGHGLWRAMAHVAWHSRDARCNRRRACCARSWRCLAARRRSCAASRWRIGRRRASQRRATGCPKRRSGRPEWLRGSRRCMRSAWPWRRLRP